MVDGLWRLERFGELFDAWASRNAVDDTCRRSFHIWVAKSATDPRRQARPAADAPDEFEGRLWFAVVPGTLTTREEWLTCTFQVFPKQRTAVCSGFEYLPGPFLEYPELV